MPELDSVPLFRAAPIVAEPDAQPPAAPTRPTPVRPPDGNGHRPPAPATAPRHRQRESSDWIDWSLVRTFRQTAAERLTAQLQSREGLDDRGRRELGRAIIGQILDDHVDARIRSSSEDVFTAAEQTQLAGAVFDALFGIGRLQPLVDDEDVENIDIIGCDNVTVRYADGRIMPADPVADSDEELVETLQFLAARSGHTERAFTPAHPKLDVSLPGRVRLTAVAWLSPRPIVSIRRATLVDVDTANLVALDMLDPGLAAFLAAAVRARKSVVISGPQGSGKTTMLRSLANEVPPGEKIGTIETEFELFLHELPHRHPLVVALEARQGTGEVGPDGTAAGEVTVDELLRHSLRHLLSRTIVGEVRGAEVYAMFKAMQSGSGSLSTTHAHSATAAIERLATLAMEAGSWATPELVYRQIAHHIDLIVQLDMQTLPDGRTYRYAAEVIEIGPGENSQGMFIGWLYQPGADGRALPTGEQPTFLPALTRAGFDPAWLEQAGGGWRPMDQIVRGRQ